MAEEDGDTEEAPKKRSKLPLILGLLVAVLGGVGSFYFMYSNGLEVEEVAAEEEDHGPVAEAYFVELDPIIIPLGEGLSNRSLRFQAHLEVRRSEQERIAALRPRILDVLNTYLRAVEVETLEDRRALLLMRSQMLRRIQVVVDEHAVHDLLITEFFIN